MFDRSKHEDLVKVTSYGSSGERTSLVPRAQLEAEKKVNHTNQKEVGQN